MIVDRGSRFVIRGSQTANDQQRIEESHAVRTVTNHS